ncbi:hypothetical protein POL68_14100 [Stigmatella sp. ncwal1]|uniref:Uncharacterized protein n=1 Tax=Stigmatella ashevillensis TaxID=2995309 RepID=A0ABT5D986_9BACT|nr:hypothetical protein [Stigmatella ashevillena]MDC0709599.1 hypothetical protein [Stigmatella ashevillena]
MKKWLTILALGTVAAATESMSSRGAEAPAPGPSAAEVDARVDERLREVLHTHLAAQQADARTAAILR